MSPAAALVLGAGIGLITVLVVFVVDHLLRWDDSTAALTVHGLAGGVGLLAVGIFADGSTGAGWNHVGADVYLGVAGQGVTGLLVAPGFQPDWPGQMQAQLVGLAALALFGFFATWLSTVPLALLIRVLRAPTQTFINDNTAEATETLPDEALASNDGRLPIDHGHDRTEESPGANPAPALRAAENAGLGREWVGDGTEEAA
jgi:ammonia channel protein AmtB